MKRWHSIIIMLLVGCMPLFVYGTAAAQWEGQHRFTLTVQGTQTTIDYVSGTNTPIPIKLRATLLVTVNSPDSDGSQTGRLYFSDVHTDDDAAGSSLSDSTGYGFVLHANQAPRLVDPIPALQEARIDPVALLANLFPWHVSGPLAAGENKTRSYTERFVVDGSPLDLLTTNSLQVYELRSQSAVLQGTIRGSVSRSLQPGRLTVDQLGSGILHIHPQTGHLLRSATTLRTTLTKNVPARSGSSAEDSEIRTLLTTSIDRLADEPPAVAPKLGDVYVDPARRFELTLPRQWHVTPAYMDHTLTMFENTEGNERLYVEMVADNGAGATDDFVSSLLKDYSRFLIDFTINAPPRATTVAGRPATFTEYSYTDNTVLTEALFHMRWDGYDVTMQYAAPPELFAHGGTELLQAVASSFKLGPSPKGAVDASALSRSPFTLYESGNLGLEIEMPMVWPPITTNDGTIQFVEIGGSGRLTIHTEEGSPNDVPLTLLQQWLQRLPHEAGAIRIVQPAAAVTIGGLPAASATFRWEAANEKMTQRLTIVNNTGILYVLSLYYDTAGYDDRQSVFDRMLSGFVPLADRARRHARTFDPHSPPPNPAGADAHLVLGRVLHDIAADGQRITAPATDVRIDFAVGTERFSAYTDDDGFFYVANVIAPAGEPIAVEAIRGPLFGLSSDVHIPVEGLITDTLGRVHILGRLMLSLDETETTVNVQLDSGVDEQTGDSTIHWFFLNRFPNSLWSDAVRNDLAKRLEKNN